MKTKEEIKDYQREYRKTKKYIAMSRARDYKRLDMEHGRGESTLTSEWILNNILNSKCHYCGETDYHKLGCDRIDNSKPHTEDNVVCCCRRCNTQRGRMKYQDYIEMLEKRKQSLKLAQKKIWAFESAERRKKRLINNVNK